MSSDDPFAFLDATDQAALIRKGEVSATEFVAATLRRIERLNPKINSVVYPMDEIAHRAAQ